MFFKKLILTIVLAFSFFFSPKNQSFNNILATDDPGLYVIEITKNAIDTLTNQSIDQNKKEVLFGKLFDKNFDIPSISRFVLGKYWKRYTHISMVQLTKTKYFLYT